jgi:hypothetical protein
LQSRLQACVPRGMEWRLLWEPKAAWSTRDRSPSAGQTRARSPITCASTAVRRQPPRRRYGPHDGVTLRTVRTMSAAVCVRFARRPEVRIAP